MRIPEVEALVALAEHCRRQGSLDVQTWHRAVLRSVGAHAGAPRSVVPDVVPRDTAAALLSLLTCFTQEQQEAMLPLFYVKQGQGFGSDKVVLLDDLMALAVFACSGSLQERLHMAFWTLNRDGAGYVTLNQLLQAADRLLAVAKAATLCVPMHTGRSVSAGRADAGATDGSTSRELMRQVLLDTHAELDTRGLNRLTEPQTFRLVMLAVQRMSQVLVQAALGSAARLGSTPPSQYGQSQDPRASGAADMRLGGDEAGGVGRRGIPGSAHASPSGSRDHTSSQASPASATAVGYVTPGPPSPVTRFPSMATLVRPASGVAGEGKSKARPGAATEGGVSVVAEWGSVALELGPASAGGAAVSGGGALSVQRVSGGRQSYVSSVYTWAVQGVSWYLQPISRSNTGTEAGAGGAAGAAGGARGDVSSIANSRSSARLWPWSVSSGGQQQQQQQRPASPPQIPAVASVASLFPVPGSPSSDTTSRGGHVPPSYSFGSFNTTASPSTPAERLSPAPTTREADLEAALNSATQAVGPANWPSESHLLTVPPAEVTEAGAGSRHQPEALMVMQTGRLGAVGPQGHSGGLGGPATVGPDATPTGMRGSGFQTMADGSLYSTRAWPSNQSLEPPQQQRVGPAGAGGPSSMRFSAPVAGRAAMLGSGDGVGSTAVIPGYSTTTIEAGKPATRQLTPLAEVREGALVPQPSLQAVDVPAVVAVTLDAARGAASGAGVAGPSKLESPTFDGERLSTLEPHASIEAAVARAQTAQKAVAQAQRSTVPTPQPTTVTRAASASPPPAAVTTGGALRQTIRNSVQAAAVKVVLNCGVCLLAVISLALLDAALATWIFRGNGYSLELSLAIVAATDIGVMMTILGFVFWRQWMANRAAQRAASASAQGAGGAGGVDGLLQLVLNPVVRMLGGTVPNTRGAGEGEANGAAPWTNKLKTVWTTIGKIAGFEMQPMGQEQAQPPHSQPVNREALHQRMDSVDFIEDASAEPMDSPQAGQPPRFRARSAAAPVPPGPFAPSQEMLHQAYGDTFAMR